MNDKLFVYGTLMDAENKYGIYLRDNSHFYANGKVKGRLYQLGDYPGAVLGGTEYIYGVILKMGNPEEALELIDIYEGFGEGQPHPNEFVRSLANIESTDGTLKCWIYTYNLSTDNLPLIVSGKYTD